jgi:cell division protein FtsB
MTLPKIKLTGINLINLIGVIVILNLVIILAQTIQRNYKLNQQLDDLKVQTAMLEDQKSQLEYNIRYYGTDAFREREARAKLGLQLPGESVIIIPRTSPKAAPKDAQKAAPDRSNLQQWFDFLAGRRLQS